MWVSFESATALGVTDHVQRDYGRHNLSFFGTAKLSWKLMISNSPQLVISSLNIFNLCYIRVVFRSQPLNSQE